MIVLIHDGVVVFLLPWKPKQGEIVIMRLGEQRRKVKL